MFFENRNNDFLKINEKIIAHVQLAKNNKAFENITNYRINQSSKNEKSCV